MLYFRTRKKVLSALHIYQDDGFSNLDDPTNILIADFWISRKQLEWKSNKHPKAAVREPDKQVQAEVTWTGYVASCEFTEIATPSMPHLTPQMRRMIGSIRSASMSGINIRNLWMWTVNKPKDQKP